MEIITPDFSYLWIVQITMLVYLGFWIYALLDMIRSEFRDPNQKLIWALLLVLIPFFGTFLYLSMSRRTKASKMNASSYFQKRINFRK